MLLASYVIPYYMLAIGKSENNNEVNNNPEIMDIRLIHKAFGLFLIPDGERYTAMV